MQNSTFARDGANKLQLCLEYSDLSFCNPKIGDLPVFNARNSQVFKLNRDSSI